MPKSPQFLAPLITSILLASISTYACYLAAGPTLGLFFGGFLIATIVAPTAFLTQQTLFFRLISLATVTASIAAIWLIPIFTTPDTLLEWLELTLALFTYTAAIASISALFARLHFPIPIATALAILLGLAWLTWPIWLSSTLASTGADRINAALVSVHPPLVANGVLLNEPPWSEKPLAYRWTNINQDIPARLPTSALPCILLHALFASALSAIAMWHAPADSVATAETQSHSQ